MDTIQVIVGLVLWAVALSFLLVGVRVTAGKELNTFRNDGSDLSTFGQRATRAMGNANENLALALGIMLLAVVTQKTGITDGLAAIFLYCRMGQSVVHLISTSVPMVLLRATLYSVQHVILIFWGLKLVGLT
jgi:uncharacterized MAPEG superfamily protein